MTSFIRMLTLSATLTLVLSSCASIETRGLPKCSGQDRRPLNADLWNWQKAKPTADMQTASEPLNFISPSAQKASVLAIQQTLVPNAPPRWNGEASQRPCR